tara:strand:+ start:138 stop:377 length:240 start_codon:yes stop_codon:yes gene_type:complete
MSSNIHIKLHTIESKLNKLENKLCTIETKINEIHELTTTNKQNCEKMSSHIDFIETIYEQLKNPINFISSKFNRLYISN